MSRRSDTAAALAARATRVAPADLMAMRPAFLRAQLTAGRRGTLGERPGRARAQSLDFDGISPYVAGDDPRLIDWRATARTGQPQMRRFAAQSRAAWMVVIDNHRDLGFGSHPHTMAKTAALVAARLAWRALILGEAVGLTLPGAPALNLPPRRGRRHLWQIFERLTTLGEGTAAAGDLATALLAASEPLRPADEIAVISDFAMPLSALAERTRGLAGRHRLTAYVVEDRLAYGPLPAGRYPAERAGAGRRVFHLSRAAAAAAAGHAAEARAARRRILMDGGWRVVDAAAWLPGEMGAQGGQ